MTRPTTPLPAPPTDPPATHGDPVGRYHRAVARLDALIAPTPPADASPAAIRARAERRLARVRRFLAYLGDPQDRAPIVHVGGTSGKGSTSVAVAAILEAAGYRVGLHTSPYLQVATEKLALGGRLIAGDAFADLVDETLGAMARWAAAAGEGVLTYGEIWTALAARWFAAEGVDAAVIEVGAGGRFDPTNVVRPAVSVITSVGLDHTATLGPTIPEIAWHKAGIVKPGAPLVTGVEAPEALAPIAAEVAAAGTSLTRVATGRTFEVLGCGAEGVRWRLLDAAGGAAGPVFATALPGRFQAANAALAVAAVRALGACGFVVGDEAIAAGLAAARLPGRFETMPGAGPRVVLDGAHNPDKVAALAEALPALRGSGRLVVVFGVIEGKGAEAMLRRLAPHADALVLTAPRVLAKAALPPDSLSEVARATGFAGSLRVEPEPPAAVEVARELAGEGGTALVTGSLYLVGNVRGRWYPDDAVVRQRTPWPTAPA